MQRKVHINKEKAKAIGNKIHHDITEIFLKVALNATTLTLTRS